MTTTIQEAEAVYREACDRYMRLVAEGCPTEHAKRAAVRAWSARTHAKNADSRNNERPNSAAVSTSVERVGF